MRLIACVLALALSACTAISVDPLDEAAVAEATVLSTQNGRQVLTAPTGYTHALGDGAFTLFAERAGPGQPWDRIVLSIRHCCNPGRITWLRVGQQNRPYEDTRINTPLTNVTYAGSTPIVTTTPMITLTLTTELTRVDLDRAVAEGMAVTYYDASNNRISKRMVPPAYARAFLSRMAGP